MRECALTDRSVFRLTGPDTHEFLQGIVTQDVAATDPALFSALLTPQGKILFDFFLTPDADGFILDCHESVGDALEKRLKLYKLRAKVTIERLEGWGVALGAHEAAHPDPRHDDLPARRPASAETLAALENGDAIYKTARMTVGAPELGLDYATEEMFLLDVNYDALNGVDYKKGCFVGQEVTSRMKRKGEVRKRTVRVEGASLTPGEAITAGDATLGQILNADADQGLALIRLDRWEKAADQGAAPLCDGVPVRIEVPDYLKRV
ncbi:MAG: folate-binding protein [Pseudomonadota bacterium]